MTPTVRLLWFLSVLGALAVGPFIHVANYGYIGNAFAMAILGGIFCLPIGACSAWWLDERGKR